jgi:hypothetical protein
MAKANRKPLKPWRNHWKKPKMEELFIPFPVFSHYKVTVVIAEDLKSAAYYIADRDYLKDPNPGDGCEAFTISQPMGGYSIIYLKPNPSMGTIAHESYHAVCAMMKMIGAAEEHEVVAYHLGFLVDAITAFNLKIAGRFTCQKRSSKSKPGNLSQRCVNTEGPSKSSSSPLPDSTTV